MKEISQTTEKLRLEIVGRSTPQIPLVTVKIAKNDSMKSKISTLLNLLSPPESNSVLLEGFARDISKLISVVEIVKSKRPGLRQYNRLLKYSDETDPYAKEGKQQSQRPIHVVGGDDIDVEASEASAVNDEGAETGAEAEADRVRQVAQEVKGAKIFDLPVLYILLSPVQLDEFLDETWTVQS
ncbi:uncharacterized protein LODBEIA_P40520 [Lodderomyces beijingensis]|uniref:DNA/RNA-binding protein Alba-like domain-containing protein n=1 Tax=Lodderomyces beijingensis TaxID=1775926 RepID=A0ABP0ZQ62_9ASCO